MSNISSISGAMSLATKCVAGAFVGQMALAFFNKQVREITLEPTSGNQSSIIKKIKDIYNDTLLGKGSDRKTWIAYSLKALSTIGIMYTVTKATQQSSFAELPGAIKADFLAFLHRIRLTKCKTD